ncbi:MAG TPA: site-2 protease family protein [Chitinophagaceae bacterium]|nr:site-2 protease family protein [Chitinophagaceae bacterium]
MENFPVPSYKPDEEQTVSPETVFVYPPKYKKQEQPTNVWLRSFTSLALYLILGYYIFPSYKMLLLITAIVIIHELGHFLAMKYYRYSDLGIFFIPLLGAYVSGTKREVSQIQSAVILLAGPLPGIIMGIIFHFIDKNSTTGYYPFDISLSQIALLFIILNLINLLPIYPLDGGQLLNRVFLDEESIISKLFIFLSAALMCWVAWKLNFYILLIFPAMMLLRLRTDKKMDNAEKRIEQEGINADTSYEEMPDEDYWKMRNILIEEHPSFKDIPKTPPYEYSSREEKVMTTIQSLLHRHIIQDLSVAGKAFIFLIWISALAAPWLLNMDMSFFHRFGF